MSDLLSYFRRSPAEGKREKGKRKPGPVAEDAIDLESMGGEISNVYLDIASVGAPAEKPRPKSPRREMAPPRETAQPPAPQPNTQAHTQQQAVTLQPPATPPPQAFVPPPSP
ncbi:MAG: hypothetical protein WBW35_07080, partial [Xanthobacteraceae bacterium]